MIGFSKQHLLDSILNSGVSNVVFRYRGNPPFVSETHHVFIVVSRVTETDDLILVHGTSQIEARLRNLATMNIDCNKTTVRIPPGKYGFFSRETMINCNSVNVINKRDMKIDSFEYVKNGSLNDDDFEKIKQAIIASPIVEPYIKDMLR